MTFESRTAQWKLDLFRGCTNAEDAFELISLYCFSEWEQEEAMDWFEQHNNVFKGAQ